MTTNLTLVHVKQLIPVYSPLLIISFCEASIPWSRWSAFLSFFHCSQLWSSDMKVICATYPQTFFSGTRKKTTS